MQKSMKSGLVQNRHKNKNQTQHCKHDEIKRNKLSLLRYFKLRGDF